MTSNTGRRTGDKNQNEGYTVENEWNVYWAKRIRDPKVEDFELNHLKVQTETGFQVILQQTPVRWSQPLDTVIPIYTGG